MSAVGAPGTRETDVIARSSERPPRDSVQENMTRQVERSRARWLGTAAAIALVIAALSSPPRATELWALLALVCGAVGLFGLWRGRVWGLFAELGAACVIAGAHPSPAWLGAAAVAAVPLGAHLALLVRADRVAALSLAGLVAFGGLGAGGLAAWLAMPAPARVRLSGAPRARLDEPAAPPSIFTHTRTLEIAAVLEDDPRALRVTLRNPSTGPLDLDVPIPDDDVRPFHAPLLDPLIRIEAWDQRGDLLQAIRSYGCGMVYSDPKVRRTRLAAGASTVYRLDLPDAWYPAKAVLPQYSHLMLMNPREILAAPRAVAVPRVALRVVYDTAAVAGSWRDDLSSASMPAGLRVHGSSALVPAASLPEDGHMPRDWSAVARWARTQ